MKRRTLARLVATASVALPLTACSLVLGLDKNYVEISCLRGCTDGATTPDTIDSPETAPTDAPVDQSSPESEAGDPCEFVDVGDSTVVDNPDYAGWPMPQFSQTNPASYSVVDEIVIDNVTKLRWRKSAAPSTLSVSDGAQYCATLDADGGPPWRLPSRVELASLLLYKTPLSPDGQFIQPCIAGQLAPISAGLAGFFWSSTPVAGSTDRHWAMYFPTCGASPYPDTTAASVRCVQGPASKPRFQVSEKCGIVRDSRTGLEWDRENKLTKFQDRQDGGPVVEYAREACTALGMDPKKGLGWVVPTQTELYSIFDSSRTQPAVSLVLFPSTPASGKLMSSSFRSKDVVAALALANGEETGEFIYQQALLKCVRHVSK